MIDTVPRPDASLPEFLAARARHTSDGALAACAGVGVFTVVAGAIWALPGWYALIAFGTCLLAFGAWGIADRELAEREPRGALPRALRGARALATVAGFAAGLFLMMVILGKALGRIIS
ncbi:MAG TPA: hypothetical protein VEB19_14825 [Gemmatimonadaceae bacterium]|nr:hypothetical protein [Gemmatimonadaceae bacterium]